MGTAIGRSRRSLLIQDAAVLLGVSRRTVYYRIREGRLETLRTRGGSQRVLVESIQRLLCDGRDATLVVPTSAGVRLDDAREADV